MAWPQHADHRPTPNGCAATWRRRLRRCGRAHASPANGNPDEECAVRGEEYVRHLVRIARELPEIAGEPPRLYVVTRDAQTVRAAMTSPTWSRPGCAA